MSCRVVGLGEVLWDLLPGGKVMGGAPANFACHARALGAEARLVSRVGNDPLGHELRRSLGQMGLPEDDLQTDASVPTGTVSVALSADGQPTFTIHEGVAWDRIEPTAEAVQVVAEADAVCFGSLAQRHSMSCNTIQSLVAFAPRPALRVFDINLRQHYFSAEVVERSLKLADVLKINDNELPVLARMLGLSGPIHEQLEALARRYDLRLIALTRGAAGSLLYSLSRVSEHPGLPVEVKDTIGAGDAFTAALTVGLLAGMDLDEINEGANTIASYVCSCAGATPALPTELRRRFVQALERTAEAGSLAFRR